MRPQLLGMRGPPAGSRALRILVLHQQAAELMRLAGSVPRAARDLYRRTAPPEEIAKEVRRRCAK
jgi:hypothetical protein